MTRNNFESMRSAMVVSQLRTNSVSDPRVIDAMGAVPRERFVPAEFASAAYADMIVPLGKGRALNPPMTIGRLLTEAAPRMSDKALIVGAGTGYSAALLARLVGSVTALEEDVALAAAAIDTAGVTRVAGPLGEGWADGAPYDLILIDGAVDHVPPAIVAQLADGGRLAVAIVDRGVSRLSIGSKAGDGFGLVPFADAEAAVLPGFARSPAFTF